MRGAIEWVAELVRGHGRADFERHGREVRARVGSQPSLRQAAFDRGEKPLPGASWPPSRRTGWEDDL